MLRTMGQWMTRIRRMAAEFQGQFQEAMREAELADLKQQIDSLKDTTNNLAAFNPIETARQELEGAFEDKPGAGVDAAAPAASDASASAEAAVPSAEAAAAAPASDGPVAAGTAAETAVAEIPSLPPPDLPPPDLPAPAKGQDFAAVPPPADPKRGEGAA